MVVRARCLLTQRDKGPPTYMMARLTISWLWCESNMLSAETELRILNDSHPRPQLAICSSVFSRDAGQWWWATGSQGQTMDTLCPLCHQHFFFCALVQGFKQLQAVFRLLAVLTNHSVFHFQYSSQKIMRYSTLHQNTGFVLDDSASLKPV